jgi:phenylpropionate dioxygenase-like ring-hydroxylating dioxygenase large terminal subunit
MKAKSILELVENSSHPFEQARAMPPSVYTSSEFLAAEIENIFSKEWICVGRSSAMSKPGDYVTIEVAGQPIIVMRGTDGQLNAMSNVCLHRMSTLLHHEGNTRAIVCPYHAWTYNLDGTLRGAPAMTHNCGFKRDDYRLPRFRCEEWLGWAMVTLNPDAPSVASSLAEVHGLIDDYQMENYVETFRETHVWDTNWKILAENFMESYHLPVCHANTIGGLSRLDEMVCPPGRPTFNYHTILKDDTLKIGLAHPNNTRMKGDRRRTTFLLSVYPSLLITITPGYFWYLSLHPRGVGQVNIIFGGGMAPEFIQSPESQQQLGQLKALLDHVNIEDRGCTEKVYRGVSSAVARQGHLSHLERPNFEFAQYIAERVGKFERVFGEFQP